MPSEPRRPDAQPELTNERVGRWLLRLRSGRAVRARIGGSGRLSLDRMQPFLALLAHQPPDGGRGSLLTATAAWGKAPPAGADGKREFQRAVRLLAQAAIEDFGAFLLLEVFTTSDRPGAGEAPAFEVFAARDPELDAVTNELARHLEAIRSEAGATEVTIERRARWRPGGVPTVLDGRSIPDGVLHLGLGIRPVYRDAESGEIYPRVLRDLRRHLTNALQRTFYFFACSETKASPSDYHSLGRRAVVRATWDVDRQLSEITDRFDFVLQVTPTNSNDAWETFEERGFERAPTFRYRPSAVDPAVLRRALFAVPVERVRDPVLDELFRTKQAELDLQIGLLDELGTRGFVLGALRLYGEIEPELLELARALVAGCPAGRGLDDTTGGQVQEEELAELARAEAAHYKALWPGFEAEVAIRDDVARGLMVSQGTILIGRGTHVSRRRVDALLQHEVGTHALTYYNARAQPLRLLSSGLNGYEALQEGLGVVAEYLSGGLSLARLRVLGARVLGVHAMLEGAEFVETFRLMTQEYGFEERTAFGMTMRIHRGGGLAKDAIYLRGLVRALEYLGAGGSLQPLAAGKIAPEHIPLVRELQLRGILGPAPLLPRYLIRPAAAERIDRLRAGAGVLDLVDEAPF